jgi:predicted ribosomally synthesized peptide with SipW-like signal peptide
MKKILISLAIIGVVAAIAVGATVAYFSDTETSIGNTFTAGSLDLKLSNDGQTYTDGVAATLTFSNMAPGSETGLANIYYKNAGTVSGKVKININYTESDNETGDTNPANEFSAATSSANEADADEMAKQLLVSVGGLDGTNGVEYYWAQQVIDEDYAGNTANAITAGAVIGTGANQKPTLFGLKNLTGLYFWNSYTTHDPEQEWTADETHYTSMQVKMNPDAGNQFQFDGVDVTITATMNQYAQPW